MKRTHTPLVIGNWKMNPGTESTAKRLYTDVRKGIARTRGVSVAIAPPAIFLHTLNRLGKSKRTMLAAQDAHQNALGSHTGETSVTMLKNAHVSYVIVGHSERRAAGETNDVVNKKVHAVLKAGLTAVVCVGEKSRDASGRYLNHIEKQVRSVFENIAPSKLAHIVVAYEPIWAISTGDGRGHTATPEDAHEMKLFIQKTLSDMYGRNMAMKTYVIYGGSVNVKNAEELLVRGMVDGFLVGGASLRASEFVEIVKIAERHES
jgi:triosephosphate isomerase